MDEFITDLYQLANHCEYGSLHDELVRDRIVVGIKDAKLSEKLQLNSKLTLETAITEVRQSEQVKKQQAVVRGEDTAAVEAVRSGSRLRQKPRNKFAGATPKPQTCTRCGKAPPHSKPQYPAREAIRRACYKDTTGGVVEQK